MRLSTECFPNWIRIRIICRKKNYKRLDETTQGHYSGIGVDVRIEDQRIVVKKVIVPSPADAAGINPGDVFLSVDGQPVKGRFLRDSIDALTGEPGTTVSLEIESVDGEIRTVENHPGVCDCSNHQFPAAGQAVWLFPRGRFQPEQRIAPGRITGLHQAGWHPASRPDYRSQKQPGRRTATGSFNGRRISATRPYRLNAGA